MSACSPVTSCLHRLLQCSATAAYVYRTAPPMAFDMSASAPCACGTLLTFPWCACRCTGRASQFETFSTIDDEAWDLKAYTGWSPSLPGIVVAFRGTDSRSIGNWVENMRYWRTDFKVPYPGADGSKVHTGAAGKQR